LKALEDKRFIRRVRSRARLIEIIGLGDEPSGIADASRWIGLRIRGLMRRCYRLSGISKSSCLIAPGVTDHVWALEEIASLIA
jgi:hypothetical protein